jgi:hypothetical protein
MLSQGHRSDSTAVESLRAQQEGKMISAAAGAVGGNVISALGDLSMGARVGLGTLAGAGIIIEANGLKSVIDNSSNNAWSLQGSKVCRGIGPTS